MRNPGAAVTFVENHDVGAPPNRALAYAFISAYPGYPFYYSSVMGDPVIANLVWVHNHKRWFGAGCEAGATLRSHGPCMLIHEAVIFLVAAVIGVGLFKRFGLGAVLGYLVAGVVIGPSGLKLVGDVEQVMKASELGVVLLLFVIGLELQPKRLWQMWGHVFGLGSLQVGLTTLLIFALGRLFGLPWAPAFVLKAMGIHTLFRETFVTSLEMTQAVLQQLGLPFSEAHRTMEIFRAADERLLDESFHLRGDVESLSKAAFQARADLEKLFEADARALSDDGAEQQKAS